MLRRIRQSKNATRGQTALEYFMMLTLLIVPMALTIRDAMLRDSKEGEKDSLVREIVDDAYGDGDRLGVIGRPYP